MSGRACWNVDRCRFDRLEREMEMESKEGKKDGFDLCKGGWEEYDDGRDKKREEG